MQALILTDETVLSVDLPPTDDEIAPPRFARGWGALGNRAYRIYTIGNGLSSVGLCVQRLAISWLAWDLSGSELWVGLMAFALFGPVLMFSSFFGVLVDRAEPLRAASIINALMAFWATLLALLSAFGLLDIITLFVTSLAIGVTSAAYAPTRLSIIPAIVPREMMSSAIGIGAMIFNASRLVGPAVAGAVLLSFPVAVAFLINAVSYAPLIYALSLVPRRPRERALPAPFFRQLAEGFGYARGNPFILRQLMLIGWSALFGRAILEVLPVYADRFYGSGTSALAALSAAAGAGALPAAFLASRLNLNSQQLQRWSILMAMLSAVALFVLAQWSALWLGLACIAAIAFGSTGAAVLSQTLIQIESADAVRGRVSSLWTMASLGGTAFGGLLLGAALQWMSVSGATMLMAGVAFSAPAIMGWMARRRAA